LPREAPTGEDDRPPAPAHDARVNEEPAPRRRGDVELQVGLESFERFRKIVRARQSAHVAVEQGEASQSVGALVVGCREERVESVNHFGARELPTGREAHGQQFEHAGVVDADADARAVAPYGEARPPTQAAGFAIESYGE